MSHFLSGNTGLGLEPELDPEPKLWTKVEPKRSRSRKKITLAPQHCMIILLQVVIYIIQCCGAGAGFTRTFLLKPELVKNLKKLRLRAVAVCRRGSVVAKLRQVL